MHVRVTLERTLRPEHDHRPERIHNWVEGLLVAGELARTVGKFDVDVLTSQCFKLRISPDERLLSFNTKLRGFRP
jgi:hypothetical protein